MAVNNSDQSQIFCHSHSIWQFYQADFADTGGCVHLVFFGIRVASLFDYMDFIHLEGVCPLTYSYRRLRSTNRLLDAATDLGLGVED